MTSPVAQRRTPDARRLLFEVEMRWGQQPVRLTAWRCKTLPTDAPVTTVHIVAFHDKHLLVVRDRKGIYGFPGGRLEPGETREAAMAREVLEEADATLEPDYQLYAVLKIECTTRLPNRIYPHEYSYMAMYAGAVRSLESITDDPAGIIAHRALLTWDQCLRQLLPHDRVLLREALAALANGSEPQRTLRRAFLGSADALPLSLPPALRETGRAAASSAPADSAFARGAGEGGRGDEGQPCRTQGE